MTKNPIFFALGGATLVGFVMFYVKNNRTKMYIAIIALILALIYYKFFKNSPESSWAPIYRDPKKEMIAMRGMANESNSVAGMIGNPVIGAMKHKGSLG